MYVRISILSPFRFPDSKTTRFLFFFFGRLKIRLRILEFPLGVLNANTIIQVPVDTFKQGNGGKDGQI